MNFLDEKIQAQVREALAPIQNPVELVVFKGSGLILPGQDAPGMQEETLGLLKELAALNEHLTVVEKTLSDPEAQALGLKLAPTILLREAARAAAIFALSAYPPGMSSAP